MPDAVFIGTVLQIASSSVAEVEPAENTVVVRVDQVLHGTQVFHDHLGEPVTVALPEGVSVAEGDVHAFQVTAWIFGTGMAVRALSVGDGNVLSAAPPDDLARIRARAAEADHVVSGIVRQVSHVPPDADHPITEHDPQWNDATVEVQEKVGGSSDASPDSVTVRFASSRDVRWQQAPKFTVGERGVWLLGAPQPATPVVAAAVAAVADDHYVVVDPDDFHRPEDEPMVRAAVEEGGDGR